MSTNPSLRRGLDHMVVAVSDLDAAIAGYRRLGFTTTPRAMHPWGTANSLVQLDRSFFELLSIEQPSGIGEPGPGEFGFGHFNQRFLETRSQGMSMLVFSSTDAAKDRERWRAAGLDTYQPFDFSRSARLPDGSEVTVAFSLSFVTHPQMPWASWFVCQQHAPEHFWKPDYQVHANGARSLERVIMVAPDPARFGEFLDALFEEGVLEDVPGGIALMLPYSRVEIVSPQHAAHMIPGVDTALLDTHGPSFLAATIAVDDPGAAHAQLTAAGVACVGRDDGVWISAGDGCGLNLQLR